MNLIGTQYATFQAGTSLVKVQDFVVPDRLPVRCYREALGCRLGARLGLSVPPAELVVDPVFGRVSIQPWLASARAPSTGRLADFRFEPDGIRTLLLDLLIANPDRRNANLLQLDELIVPIDFNVAFGFASDVPRVEDPDLTIMRWFGTRGVLALPRNGLVAIETEIARLEHLLDERYIRAAARSLSERFIDAPERERLTRGLLDRRAQLGAWIREWWHRTVVPLHRLNEGMS